MTNDDTIHDADAQLSKNYEHLAPKSKRVIDAISELQPKRASVTATEIATEAGCTPSHVSYVRTNFPHIIEERLGVMRAEPVPDGGTTQYDVTLDETDAFKMIKSLPPELAEIIYNQVRL